MPGLFGFVGTGAAREAAEFAGAMARALEPEGVYRVELYHSANAGMGRVTLGLANPEPQPVWNEGKSRCAVLEG
jgi:asparagine synthase (glutamine-hydrolysing)